MMFQNIVASLSYSAHLYAFEFIGVSLTLHISFKKIALMKQTLILMTIPFRFLSNVVSVG